MRFEAEILDLGRALAIELPFDPKEAFGKVRAPVRVELQGFEFRTTIGAMGGRYLIGLNKEVRAGAGVSAADRVTVEVEPDEGPRTVEVPADLAAGLDRKARQFFDSLAYTHRKEYVRWIESAKRAETRAARIEKAAAMLHEGVKAP